MAYETHDPQARAERLAAERRYSAAPPRRGAMSGILVALGIVLLLIIGIAMFVPVEGTTTGTVEIEPAAGAAQPAADGAAQETTTPSGTDAVPSIPSE